MRASTIRRPPAHLSVVPRTRTGHRALESVRPVLLLVAAGGVAVGAASGEPATSLLLEYRTRALAIVFVAIAATGWWVGVRLRRSWGFELVPAAAGAVAATALIGALAGTPYGPGGLGGDQTFRTAAVTRFADSWHNADFTAKGLPTFYPPAYFWVLGRSAAWFGVEPWRMLKVGAVVAALAIPMVAFVLWRRVVPERTAALVSVVAIVVENFYEPYSWLVIVAFIPWWLEVVHGVRRPGHPPGNPVLLGAIGALMIVTYWYFFVVGAVGFAIKLVVDRRDGRFEGRELRRTGRVVAVAAALSAIYWVPLAFSVVRADHPESLGNRWFSSSHPQLPLPMLEASTTGIVCLVGVVYLAWAYRHDLVARGLTMLLGATYAWYLVGAVAADAGHPLLSFRAKPLVPMLLVIAGVIGLVQLAEFSFDRFGHGEILRIGAAFGIMLGVYAAHGFIDDVRASSYTDAARNTARPNASPPDPSVADLQHIIESRVGHHAVLLSDRIDVLALYPNHAFVVWDAHYAHPASEFGQRIEFLTQLSRSDDPATFRALIEHNPYDTIDALVLVADGNDLVFRYGADAFPAGTHSSEIRYPKTLFADFEQIPVGDHILAVPN